MKFKKFFNQEPDNKHSGESDEILPLKESKPYPTDLEPENILKNAGYKVKSRILTDFGIQYELFKKIDKDTLESLGETLVKGNLIFVIV